ncbi:hypothetical protein ACHAXT_005130 [Thalassiosira profunda]
MLCVQRKFQSDVDLKMRWQGRLSNSRRDRGTAAYVPLGVVESCGVMLTTEGGVVSMEML